MSEKVYNEMKAEIESLVNKLSTIKDNLDRGVMTTEIENVKSIQQELYKQLENIDNNRGRARDLDANKGEKVQLGDLLREGFMESLEIEIMAANNDEQLKSLMAKVTEFEVLRDVKKEKTPLLITAFQKLSAEAQKDFLKGMEKNRRQKFENQVKEQIETQKSEKSHEAATEIEVEENVVVEKTAYDSLNFSKLNPTEIKAIIEEYKGNDVDLNAIVKKVLESNKDKKNAYVKQAILNMEKPQEHIFSLKLETQDFINILMNMPPDKRVEVLKDARVSDSIKSSSKMLNGLSNDAKNDIITTIKDDKAKDEAKKQLRVEKSVQQKQEVQEGVGTGEVVEENEVVETKKEFKLFGKFREYVEFSKKIINSKEPLTEVCSNIIESSLSERQKTSLLEKAVKILEPEALVGLYLTSNEEVKKIIEVGIKKNQEVFDRISSIKVEGKDTLLANIENAEPKKENIMIKGAQTFSAFASQAIDKLRETCKEKIATIDLQKSVIAKFVENIKNLGFTKEEHTKDEGRV